MIKKTITYEDFNGVTKTKDFYFHLSKVDMMELSLDGLFEKELKEAVQREDKLKIFQMFKRLIFLSVGTRSENGEEFIRPEMFREAFMSSPAFDQLVMDLFTSEDHGASFVAGLMPKDMQEKVNKEIETKNIVDPFKEEPAWITEGRVPTAQEFAAATEEQKKLAFSRKIHTES